MPVSSVIDQFRPGGQSVEWVVVGAGPCGLSAANQLLANGVPAEDVLIVSPAPVQRSPSELSPGAPTVRSAYLGALDGGALSKTVHGQTISLQDHSVSAQPSAQWGASNLPLPASVFPANDASFLAAYRTTSRRWHVSAEEDDLLPLYPLTGEAVGDLPRKRLAHHVLATSRAEGAGHARLAVRGRSYGEHGCSGQGLCFHGCPSHAPWSAAEELATTVEEHPGLRVITDVVDRLERLNGQTTRLLCSTMSLTAKRVIVSAGWRATSTLLGGRAPRLGASAELQQSSVVMASFLLGTPASEDDFFRHFTYHDLVLPHLDTDGGLSALTQVYLPTQELAGRLLASMPGARFTAPFIRTVLGNRAGARATTSALRRVGVAMTFFPGSVDWTSAAEELSVWRRVVPRDLGLLLDGVGGRVVSAKKLVLTGGGSQHVGAWEAYRQVIPRLLSGDANYLAGTPGGARAVAGDPCLLPVLPPGPHTASAAACTRVLVDALVRDLA